jgi:hypothetical protein
MNILRYGNDVVVKNVECGTCKSVIEYTKRDLTLESYLEVKEINSDGSGTVSPCNFYTLICPLCGNRNYVESY